MKDAPEGFPPETKGELRRRAEIAKELHEAQELQRDEIARQNEAKQAAKAAAPPKIETYTLHVAKRTLADDTVQWRLTVRRDNRKVVQTQWRPRYQFLAEYVHFLTGQWGDMILAGAGRPLSPE